MFHNQLHPTISFGEITHHINPSSLHKTNMFKTPKANSYSQPLLPTTNNKTTPKHADSKNPSAPRIQPGAYNNNHAPANSNARTAVSNWLATSQEFEKPPAPAPVADPAALPERRCREYWLEISRDLDRRLEARSSEEECKDSNKLGASRAHAKPVFDRQFELDFLKIEKEKLTPRNERKTSTEIVVTRSPVMMGSPEKLGSERKKSVEASISVFKEKLEKRKPEPEQLEGVRENKADETVKVATKQLEVAKSKEADDAVRAKEKEEQLNVTESQKADDAVKTKEKEEQFEVAEPKKTDDAVSAKEKEEQLEAVESKKADETATVRAKAKKLAADAMRKKYVEGRARDIHVNLLHCRPFDIDAVRREFSEKEVGDIKNIVRALGFGKMKMR